MTDRNHQCDTLLNHALAYTRRGWSVFPCSCTDEKPLTENGLHDATTDSGQIKAWWTRWPNASIGAPAGATNGWWVLYVKRPKKPGDPDGFKSLVGLEAKYGKLPGALRLATSDGGIQYFLKWDGRDIRSSSSKIAPGIDVIGEGGYVILPPSRRPLMGGVND